MEKHKYLFYAFTVNGHDSMFCNSYKDAMEEMSCFIEDDDDESYGIEPVHGIWELVRRFGAFEDYDDIWMEEVLERVTTMVMAKKKLKEELQEKDKNSQTKKAE